MIDANILRMGRTALVNYGYEKRAVNVMKELTGRDESGELTVRMKTQAARARHAETALLRLTAVEQDLLTCTYIEARPGNVRRLAAKYGCDGDTIRKMTDDALESFCVYYFAGNEKSRGGEAAADISALFLRNDEAVRPVPSLIDRARLLGL